MKTVKFGKTEKQQRETKLMKMTFSIFLLMYHQYFILQPSIYKYIKKQTNTKLILRARFHESDFQL